MNQILLGKLSGQVEISAEEINDEVRTIGGAATATSTTIALAYKMLSMHPDIQQRLYKEMCDALQENEYPITNVVMSRYETNLL